MICHRQNQKDCNARLERLRALDFSIQETVLYLDAYPEHAEALQYYHALLEERAILLAEYENNCGPQTIYGNQSQTSWDWVKAPWPWEIDAN